MTTKNNTIKLRLLWKYGNRCAICGKKIRNFEDLTVDHIIPLDKGGRKVIENCQLAHKACNAAKSNILPEEHEKILRYNRRRILRMRMRRVIFFW